MKYKALTPEDYLRQLPEERQVVVEKLRQVIKTHLPEGFEEMINYDMIGYVVPLSLYASGYHCGKDQPLPFINIASQKNFVAVYHMGIYGMPEILDWFKEAYAQRVPGKLDMGKSCIRFKKMETIPYDLIGELCEKISPEMLIKMYEQSLEVVTKLKV